MSYDNAHSANMAIKVINGKQALGKRLKVELKKGGPAFATPTRSGSQQQGRGEGSSTSRHHSRKAPAGKTFNLSKRQSA